MGAKVLAGIIGLIIIVVLVQNCVLGDDDPSPSINRPGSIPTATPPAEQSEAVLLGSGDAGGGGGGSGGQTQSGGGGTYTVQSGDTLGAIAVRFNVPADGQAAWIAEVLRLNNMQDARQLQSGQELQLPVVAATARPSGTATPRPTGTAAAATGTPRPSATGTVPTQTPRAGGGSAATYTVVSGDSPFLIAEKHCVENPAPWVDELLEINNVEANALRVGEVLDLPEDTPALCNPDAGAAADDEEEDEATPTATNAP
jgi:LysM repeat protein